VRVLGASSLVSGLLLSVFGVARILAVTFIGAVTNRFPRSYAFFTAVGAIALGIGLIGVSTHEYMVVGAIAFFSLGDAIALPFIHDLVSAMPAPDSRAGVVTVFGVLLAFTNFVTVFFVAAGLAACYALVAVLVVGLDPAAFDVS
jgi:MFS family permease